MNQFQTRTGKTPDWGVSVIRIALLAAGLGLTAEAQVTVQVVGRTPTQALLSYTATGSCTVEVSESQTYQPLVHDVDPMLFPGSNLDTRPEALSSGTNHIFLVGKRRTDKASDGLNYSRALQTNTTHYYRITCGGQVTAGSFTTANIPFGSTYADVLPADPQAPGEYLWPSLSRTDRTETIVDPYTGVLAKHLSMPGDMLNDGSSLFFPANTSGGMNQTCNRNLSANGFYHCLLIGSGGSFPSFYGVNPTTGEARFLGSPYFIAQLYAGVGSGYRLCDTQSGALWDSTDANVFYCNSPDSNNNLVIVKGTYTGNDQTILATAQTPQPMAPATYSVLTPGPNNTLTQLLKAYDPSYDAAKFGCSAMGVQANYMLIACLRSIQDSYAWLGVLDLGNKQPIGAGGTGRVAAFIKMWEKAGSRWCGNHSFEFISDVPVMSVSTQMLKGAYTFGQGPYRVSLVNSMSATQKGSQTTINITSGWDPAWGALPDGYQAGEPVSPNPDHFLMTAQVGDVFYIDGEIVRIAQKLSSTQWVVERGLGSDQPLPISHSPGAILQAECNSFLQGGRVDGTQVIFFPQYMWWNFVNSPDANNLSYYMENFGTHVVSRGNYRVSTEYAIRSGSPADVSTWGNTNWNSAINPSPQFAGATAWASGVSFQKHPSMQDNDPSFFIDQLPLIGTNVFTVQNSTASRSLGGDLYQYFYNGLDDPDYGGDGLSRKQWGTLATAGSYILRDISGPSSQITTDSQSAYTYCVAYKPGECRSGSAVGDVFFNAPGIDTAHAWCTGGEYATNFKDICIGDYPTIGVSVSQFKLQSDTTGQSIRNIAKLWGGYRTWSGTSNTKLLPDGSWALLFPLAIHSPDFYSSANWIHPLLLKMPPITPPDGIDRTTFVRASLSLAPPAGKGVVAAKVYFGYQEQGSPNQYYCSSRRESCVAVSSGVTDSNPYLYAQTDSYVPAPCATSCVITIPVLPLHTAYFRIAYLDAANNEVASELGMASEQSIARLNSTATPPSASISLSPSYVSRQASQNVQFTATVTGSANTAVTWSMSPSLGSLSNGSYTAPSAINTSQTVTITATSVADPSKSGTATVQLTPAASASVAVSPSSTTLSASQTRQFTATVTGSTNTAVTWSMNPSLGSLSNGLYSAPSTISTPQAITITATSVADPSNTGTATVQLVPNGISVSVTPPSATLSSSQSTQLTATVTGSVVTGVTWSMSPSLGTLSNGLYTAPSSISASQTVTITAASVADPSRSGTATIQLTPTATVGVNVAVSPLSATLSASQTRQFTAAVTGSTNTAVTWSMSPPFGSLSNGLYATPSAISAQQTVTITATSVADPSKSGTATVQLIPNNGVSVSLTPPNATLSSSQSTQFTATVYGSANTAVTWSTPSLGILSNGLYTAPSSINSAQSVTITATSVADPSKFSTATVQLVANINVKMNPAKATLAPSQAQQFTALVNGVPDATVVWSKDSGPGVMSSTGLYTAPGAVSTPTTVRITGTLRTSDGTAIATSAIVTVMPDDGPPVITRAVNGASLGQGPISPGEILTLQGSGLGPDVPATFSVDSSGMVATTLANTQVFFDGVPTSLLDVQSSQIRLVVPYSVTPGTSVKVEVEYQGERSNALTLPVAPYAPGLFTLGGGQGAINNEDGTVNSPANPAAAGSLVSLYATGIGQTNPPSVEGHLAGDPAPAPLTPISVKIGGVDAEVLYSGSLPGMVPGVLLINVRIPASAPIGSAVPIVFSIGGALSQAGVTIAVH